MTTSQIPPAPRQGRHHQSPSRADIPAGRPGAPIGQYPAGRPAYASPQPSGYAQRPQHAPAQWGPANRAPSGPAQPYPGQAYPAQPYPAQSQPSQSIPSQSIPAQHVPTEHTSGQHAPAQHAPAQHAPAQHVPAQHVPAQHVPAQHVPAQHGPAEQVPAQPYPAQPAAQAPRNGLGIAALCLGIVGMLFGLVPFTGFIAFALGAIGIVLGLVGFARSRRRIATNTKTALAGAVLSAIAIALGIWGMVIVFTGLSQLSEDLSQIPSPATAAAPGQAVLPADINTPATTAPRTYQLEVTGDAGKMMVGYGTNNATSTASDYQTLPWRKTVEAAGDYPYASVTATSFGPGSITCNITDTSTGAVVATQTAKSLDNNEYSSANVSCNTMG